MDKNINIPPINYILETANKRATANISAKLVKPEFRADYIKMMKRQLLESLTEKMVEDNVMFTVENDGNDGLKLKFNSYILNQEQMAMLVTKVSTDTLRLKTILELNIDKL